MAPKKAQLSYFMIIGSLLLLGFFLVTFVDVGNNPQIEQTFGFDNVISIKAYVSECIERAAVKATYQFGIQQGFHTPPKQSFVSKGTQIAYYALHEQNIMRPISFFENELSKIMDDQLQSECRDLSPLRDSGYVFDSQNPRSTVSILSSKILFEVSYPIVIKGRQKITLDRFSHILPIRTGHMLDLSRVLVAEIEEDPANLNLNLFSDQDIGISVFQIDRCTHLYTLQDYLLRPEKAPDDYVHLFAVAFSEQYCSPEISEQLTQ